MDEEPKAPWQQGYAAYGDDSMCEHDNPYESGSQDWNDWLSGYYSAKWNLFRSTP